MKLSNYVIEIKDFPRKNIHLWYSTARDDATLISEENKKAVLELKGDNTNEIADSLKKMKFLVPDEFDERKWGEFIFNSVNYSREILGLIIAPTMKCNLNCIYCFEREEAKVKSMTLDTAQRIIKWVQKTLKVHPVRKLEVQYFGGEPTQNEVVVKYLAKQFINIAEKYKLELKSYIVTNGYFSKSYVDELIKLQIKNIQFTIDGEDDVHNYRRPACNGSPSFETIYSNFIKVVNNAHKFEDIMLRINIDESNMNTISSLLHKIAKDVNAKAITIDINETSWLNKNLNEYVPISEMVLELTREAVKLGFKYDFHMGSFAVCNYSKMNSIVIGPDAQIYKCLLMIEETAFKVCDIDEYYQSFSLIDYVQTSIPQDCFGCKYLPMCFGGCKLTAFRKYKDKNKHVCNRAYLDKYMESYLKLYYGTLINDNITSRT